MPIEINVVSLQKIYLHNGVGCLYKNTDKESVMNPSYCFLCVGLSQEEHEKIEKGDEFVTVPSAELKRLRVDAYPYLM